MNSLQDRDQKVLWHPFTQVALDDPPLVITHGKDALIYDQDGDEYIDAIASWWAVLHGHTHPHITEKLSEQLHRIHHVIFSAFTHEPAIELAERLLTHLPENQSKLFLSDNGSTAVEIAVKMAVQYWSNQGIQKTKIVAFEQAYHGDTFGTMALSEDDAFTKPFQKLLFPIERIPTPVPGREDEALSKLEAIVKGGDVAAFVFEPLIAGATGMHMYQESILEALVACCDKHDVFTIADEVMTGFGRTGHDFASQALETSPDMICFSKGLTGGTMALGATSTTERIYEGFRSDSRYHALLHGHTFTGNPLACVAGLASLDVFETEGSRADRQRIEKRHSEFVQKLLQLEGVKNPRAKGVVFACEIQSAEADGYVSSMRDKLLRFFLEKKAHLRPLGNTVYILPPYCITDKQLDTVYGVILEGIDRFGK